MDTDRSSQHESASDNEGTKNEDIEAQLPTLSSRRGKSLTPVNDKLASANPILMPARNPPSYTIFDVFPFSLLVHFLTKRGKKLGGKKAAKEKLKQRVVSHNIPLEITLYLVSGTSVFKCCD